MSGGLLQLEDIPQLNMNKKILNRILKKSRHPGLLEALTEKLSLTDLQSLLLKVYQTKSQKLTPKDLVTQYSQNRFVKPAQIDPREIIKFDLHAYSLLPKEFSILELSPVCPLGTNSVLAPISQNNTVSTIRNTEVCSDPTGVLAIECALRRQTLYSQNPRSTKTIKLGTSSRVLRAQAFDEPAAFAHFRIFALCTAGRDQGSFLFEIESLKEQINYYLELLTKADAIHFDVKGVRVLFVIYNLDFLNNFESKILHPLKSSHPQIQFEIDTDNSSGREYYSLLRFQMFAQNAAGEECFLIDGGFTDWTQQLLSNKKERLLTSGMGSERFIYCFGKKNMEY